MLEAGVPTRGDRVIITMGSPLAAPGTTKLMKAHLLGSDPTVTWIEDILTPTPRLTYAPLSFHLKG